MLADMLTTVNGLELSYRAHGHGPTLVLVHAFPLNMEMWAPQIEALTDRCHLVTLDLRGFGASQVTDGVFTIDDLASDVHGLLGRIGHHRCVLGGLSLGGYVALAYARRYGQQLRGLILADTRATADDAEARESRLASIAAIEKQGAAALAAAMPSRLLAPGTVETRPELVAQLSGWIGDTDPRTLIGAQKAMANRNDATSILPLLKVPTLVLVGEQDAVTPPEEAERMAASIADATVVKIPNAGHLSNLENPEAFNAAVAAFMARFAD